MNRLMIFGVNSFTGKHFLNIINSVGSCRVIGIDIEDNPFVDSIEYEKVVYYSAGRIKELFYKYRPDYIINFAGIFGSGKNSGIMEEVNYFIPKAILDAASDRSVYIKKILLVGSAAEYGRPEYLPIDENHPINPVNYYGFTKSLQTYYARYLIRYWNLPVVIVRPFNLLGIGMSDNLVVQSFINRIKETIDGKISVGNIESRRDFLSIYDAVRAYRDILVSDSVIGEYNVSSGKSVAVKDILDVLIRKSGKNIEYVVDKVYLRKNDVREIYGSYEKLEASINWKPVYELNTILEEMWEYAGK